MTEAEWNTCDDPRAMLELWRERATDRKLRLFGCAAARQEWHLLVDERSRRAVELAEQFADGMVAVEELTRSRAAALDPANKDLLRATDEEFLQIVAAILAYDVTCTQPSVRDEHVAWSIAVAGTTVLPAASRLIRDIFGNPFRPVTLDPTWRTPTVIALAQAAYEERALPEGTLDAARLAVLADALEEVGCTSAEMLDHCRNPGIHVRGCWVVDALLGKS